VDIDYLRLTGAVVIGVSMVMLSMYYVYRRGMAIRLAAILLGCITLATFVAFALGKEGLEWGRVALALAVVVPVLVYAFIWLSRQLVTPARQIAAAAARIAEGDIGQQLEVEGRDEIAEMAAAFRQMMVYLQDMAAAADHLAQSDLTVNVVPKSERDVLGNAFVKMLSSLRDLVGQVQRSAAEVATASQEIQMASEQSAMATGQVASTMQQVAQGSAQQSMSVNQTASTMEQVSRAIDGVSRGAQEQSVAVTQSADMANQMSAAIEQVVANAQGGVDYSTRATKICGTGAEVIQETVQGMLAIKRTQDEALAKVREMGQRSEEVGVIVETIEKIASQTNLLALNANIEAARAGEYGKGFAVVADAVGKLALDAANATREIAGLVKGIQKTATEAVESVKLGTVEVDAGVGRANKSRQALADIEDASSNVNQQMREIAKAAQQMSVLVSDMVSSMDAVSAVVEENTAATEEMASSAEEVLSTVEEVASISEENSAATEEASSAVEEVSAQSEEVTASAQALSMMAQDLQKLVARFKLPEV